MDEYYEFKEGQFRLTSFPEADAVEPGTDWEDGLRQNGWFKISAMPEYAAAELSQVRVTIYGRRDQNTRMVQITFEDEEDLVIFCPRRFDLFMLLRDFVYPLCSHANWALITGRLLNLTFCLLHPEFGLKCAQRASAYDARCEASDRLRKKTRKQPV